MAAKKTSTTLKKTPSQGKSTASRKGRTSKAQDKKSAGKENPGSEEVTIDRRRKSRREESSEPAAPKLERRTKVQRRRQIDPTTCERDYSDQEVEFMNALDHYKRVSGRMFPTCSEVLEVIRNLGYVQLSPAELAQVRPESIQEPALEAETETSAEELEEEVF